MKEALEVALGVFIAKLAYDVLVGAVLVEGVKRLYSKVKSAKK